MQTMRLPKQLSQRAGKIRLLLLDVDGVLTDGRVIYDDQGRELKAFHIHDGYGLNRLRESGCQLGIISGRESKAVDRRARELKIEILHQGVSDKLSVYEDIIATLGLSDREVAYVGDDLIDLPLFGRVGLAVAVASAHPSVRKAAHWITQNGGGEGAVREVTDLLLALRAPRISTV